MNRRRTSREASRSRAAARTTSRRRTTGASKRTSGTPGTLGTSATLTVRAHAKVNLDLRVLGSRPDGYHELRTVFQTIELHDLVTCWARKGPLALKSKAAGVPLDQTNLVWQAAASLWTALGRPGDPQDTVISIDKEIPIAA